MVTLLNIVTLLQSGDCKRQKELLLQLCASVPLCPVLSPHKLCTLTLLLYFKE